MDRAFSHYCHAVRHCREKLSFEDAIARQFEGSKKISVPPQKKQPPAYIARGLYEDQLKIWFKLFSKQQLFFILSEDFFKNPHNQLNRVLEFLGLPEYRLKDYKEFNASKYKSPDLQKSECMSSELRKKLADYYEPFNRKLYDLLEEDLKWE